MEICEDYSGIFHFFYAPLNENCLVFHKMTTIRESAVGVHQASYVRRVESEDNELIRSSLSR